MSTSLGAYALSPLLQTLLAWPQTPLRLKATMLLHPLVKLMQKEVLGWTRIHLPTLLSLLKKKGFPTAPSSSDCCLRTTLITMRLASSVVSLDTLGFTVSGTNARSA